MGDIITAADKKQFIEWFLQNYELKNPEAEWLLQYLSSNEDLLTRVHFTEHFRNAPKAILMSATCVPTTGFKFYKNKRVTSDVEKAFLDMHNHPDEDVYVTLYFHDRTVCQEYATVLELSESAQSKISVEEVLMSLQAEMWLDEISRKYELDLLQQEIDRALLLRDKAAFTALALRYKEFLHSSGDVD